MKKVLITGASGFAGGFLAEYILTLKEYEVYGIYHSDDSLQKSPVKNTISFKKVDLMNAEEVKTAVSEIQPDYIFHLAAATSPAASFKDPIETFQTNINAQVNVFEALRSANLLHTRTLIASSSEIYGYVRPEDVPVDEETPHRPANPYAVSKIAQDYLGFQYNLSYNLAIIRARPFNHVGPGQSPVFVVSDFAKQVADIEKNAKEPVIKVGNLEAKRDFTDVRDIVRAYVTLLEKGIAGEAYNIGSGSSRSAQSILTMLLSLSSKEIRVEQDMAKMRPSDIPDIICDNKKLTDLTGWKPEIPFEKTVKDTLDYWRNLA